MYCEGAEGVGHEHPAEGNDEISPLECDRRLQSAHEFDRHRRPASWQLSAGPMDAAEEMVVGLFYLVT